MGTDTPMIDHRNNYDTAHYRLVDRFKETETTSPYRNLASYLANDTIKAHHLLMTLPRPQFNNVVDNILTKGNQTSNDVRVRLLELVSSSIEPPTKGKALFNKNKPTDKVTKPAQPSNPTRAGKTVPPTGNNCSWCTKYRLKAEAHTFKNCAPLKEYNHTGIIPAPSASSSKEVVPRRANLSQGIIEEGNSIALIVSSFSYQRTPPLPSPALMTHSDNTYEVWIFDTRASYYITADFSHLHDLVPCQVGLTVGGGRIMHASY